MFDLFRCVGSVVDVLSLVFGILLYFLGGIYVSCVIYLFLDLSGFVGLGHRGVIISLTDWDYLGATLAINQNRWNPLLWDYWGYLGATFANEQVIGYHWSGATGATLALPLPTSKSLDAIALVLLVPP